MHYENDGFYLIIMKIYAFSYTIKNDIDCTSMPYNTINQVDEILKKVPHSDGIPGHCKDIQVLRQPVRHCFFNASELIWARIKTYIAKRNSTCKLADVLQLTKDAIANVSLNKYFRGKDAMVCMKFYS